MKKEEIALKLTALRSSVSNWLKEARAFYFNPRDTQDLFVRFNNIRDTLKFSYRTLFEDLPDREVPKSSGTTDYDGRGYIRREHFELLLNDIDYCLRILQNNIGQINKPISKNQLDKITLKDLISMLLRLTLGAAFVLFIIACSILTFTYNFGYQMASFYNSGLNNHIVSLKQLNSDQIRLLEEIYKYQKTNNVNKIIILKIGLVIDEATNKGTTLNIAINVLGRRADQTHFEDLITSMPEHFLKRLPATRWDDPYVLTVTEEARKLLDRNS